MVGVLISSAAIADEVSAYRAAALRYCNALAKYRFPGKYYDWDSDQAAVYKDCMFAFGERP
jgi:hypothetical protein